MSADWKWNQIKKDIEDGLSVDSKFIHETEMRAAAMQAQVQKIPHQERLNSEAQAQLFSDIRERIPKHATKIDQKDIDIARLLKAVDLAVEAMQQANYQGDYYDQKPHKAMEVVIRNREALAQLKVISDGSEEK